MTEYASKPHNIKAFKFDGIKTEYEEWFTIAAQHNRVSVTLGHKDQYYITIYNKDETYIRASLGEWICMNDQKTIFKLTNDEFNAGFYLKDDL